MDGVTDDTVAVQDSIFYAERYSREVFFPGSGTNHLLMTTTWITNGVPILIKGNGAQIDVYYSQPGDVTNSRLSAAFIIGSHNVTIDGLKFRTVSTNYNPITEEATTTGYYSPINIYLGTNVVIRNCEFDVYTGRGIVSSGSYGVIENCKFFNGCGITYGVGQPHNWLYFQNTVPLGADQIYLSPIGCRVTDNYFTGSNAFKRIVFFSSANRFTFSRNKMIDIWSPDSAVTAYSGDLETSRYETQPLSAAQQQSTGCGMLPIGSIRFCWRIATFISWDRLVQVTPRLCFSSQPIQPTTLGLLATDST
jgi:hypothetical protein